MFGEQALHEYFSMADRLESRIQFEAALGSFPQHAKTHPKQIGGADQLYDEERLPPRCSESRRVPMPQQTYARGSPHTPNSPAMPLLKP